MRAMSVSPLLQALPVQTPPIRTPPSSAPRMATEIEEEVETTSQTSLSPPWHVIVHDDPITLMSYVTLALQKVFGYSTAKANRLMMTVHNSGKAVVWTGERERAEIYVQKLQTWQLKATLELAPV